MSVSQLEWGRQKVRQVKWKGVFTGGSEASLAVYYYYFVKNLESHRKVYFFISKISEKCSFSNALVSIGSCPKILVITSSNFTFLECQALSEIMTMKAVGQVQTFNLLNFYCKIALFQ